METAPSSRGSIDQLTAEPLSVERSRSGTLAITAVATAAAIGGATYWWYRESKRSQARSQRTLKVSSQASFDRWLSSSGPADALSGAVNAVADQRQPTATGSAATSAQPLYPSAAAADAEGGAAAAADGGGTSDALRETEGGAGFRADDSAAGDHVGGGSAIEAAKKTTAAGLHPRQDSVGLQRISPFKRARAQAVALSEASDSAHSSLDLPSGRPSVSSARESKDAQRAVPLQQQADNQVDDAATAAIAAAAAADFDGGTEADAGLESESVTTASCRMVPSAAADIGAWRKERNAQGRASEDAMQEPNLRLRPGTHTPGTADIMLKALRASPQRLGSGGFAAADAQSPGSSRSAPQGIRRASAPVIHRMGSGGSAAAARAEAAANAFGSDARAARTSRRGSADKHAPSNLGTLLPTLDEAAVAANAEDAINIRAEEVARRIDALQQGDNPPTTEGNPDDAPPVGIAAEASAKLPAPPSSGSAASSAKEAAAALLGSGGGSAKRFSVDVPPMEFMPRKALLPDGQRLSFDSALDRARIQQSVAALAAEVNLRSDSQTTGADTSVAPASPEGSDCSTPFGAWVQRSHTPSWAIDPAEIEICKRPDGSVWSLGEGGYNKVLKALRGGVSPVAVKVFPLIGENAAKSQADFSREAYIMKRCRDRNIVQFLGTSIDRDQALLVCEFMEAGDLHKALQRDQQGQLLWYKRSINSYREGVDPTPGMGKRIALDIARGLHFLHSQRIIHFDIKTPNVLMGRNSSAKIGDLGVAQHMSDSQTSIEPDELVGTFAWTAPEMLMREPCTPAVDIYSFGVVLWELVTGEDPVRGQLRPPRRTECPAGVADLITRCTSSRPESRPTAKEVVDVLMRQDVLIEQRAAVTRRAASRAGAGGRGSDGSEKPLAELVDALVEYAHAVYGPDCTFSREDAIAQGIAKDYKTYVDYIQALRDALAVPGHDAHGSAPNKRVVQLALAMRRNFGIKLTLNSRVFRDSRAVDLEQAVEQDSAAAKPQDSARERSTTIDYRPVLEAMRLTDWQKDAFVRARVAVGQRQSELLEARQKLVNQLQGFAVHDDDNSYASALESSSQLSRNVEDEGFLLNRFYIHIMFELLEPLQQARTEVAAAPYPADVVAIGELLMKEADARRASAAARGRSDMISRLNNSRGQALGAMLRRPS